MINQRVKQHMSSPKDLMIINFIKSMHGNIQAIKKKDVEWARNASLAQMRKFDWTQVDEPLMKELICNFCCAIDSQSWRNDKSI